MKQTVLPVIKNHKNLELFLKSKLEWCVLLDFHLNFMEDILQRLHQVQKKGIVHMDLINGIGNDPAGCEFMIQRLHVDGIISTKPNVVKTAKKHQCLSIFRLFLIDTRSIAKGCALANEVQPDFIEILPATTTNATLIIRAYTDINLIGGGLIQNQEDIQHCLQQGMKAITSSNLTLCLSFEKQ